MSRLCLIYKWKKKLLFCTDESVVYWSVFWLWQVHPNSIHICAVVVEYETKTGRVNKGVATNWLKNKMPTDNGHKATVPMYIRKSQFRLPFKSMNPVIMVGPGTGIAPFMGFIQERGWLKEQGRKTLLSASSV